MTFYQQMTTQDMKSILTKLIFKIIFQLKHNFCTCIDKIKISRHLSNSQMFFFLQVLNWILESKSYQFAFQLIAIIPKACRDQTKCYRNAGINKSFLKFRYITNDYDTYRPPYHLVWEKWLEEQYHYLLTIQNHLMLVPITPWCLETDHLGRSYSGK